MERKKIIEFYKNTDYQNEVRNGFPPRPSEWHFPILLKKIIKENEGLVEQLGENTENKVIKIQLDEEDCKNIRTTFLHEAIFHLYKGFYNYLAAKRLYRGGVEHWIEITNYYSKLYLARCINTILGHQRYAVQANKDYFDEEIMKIVNPKGLNKLKNGNLRVGYSIDLKVNIESSKGELIISNKGISTHQDTWTIYKSFSVEELDLWRLDNFDRDDWDMIDQRNKENYSFDGYKQLDFNLAPSSFPGYFNRKMIKDTSQFIYDEIIGEVLQNFQEIYHLLNEFDVEGLPIEKEKFQFMIEDMLDDTPEKEKLIDLCQRNFPLENEYSWEINKFYEDN